MSEGQEVTCKNIPAPPLSEADGGEYGLRGPQAGLSNLTKTQPVDVDVLTGASSAAASSLPLEQVTTTT